MARKKKPSARQRGSGVIKKIKSGASAIREGISGAAEEAGVKKPIESAAKKVASKAKDLGSRATNKFKT